MSPRLTMALQVRSVTTTGVCRLCLVKTVCVQLVEIYFSVLQRTDAASLDGLAANILTFQARYEIMAMPFEWKFTRADLTKLLQRLASKDHGQLSDAA
jgi:hypothetical protein